jgi:hypothetical protein
MVVSLPNCRTTAHSFWIWYKQVGSDRLEPRSGSTFKAVGCIVVFAMQPTVKIQNKYEPIYWFDKFYMKYIIHQIPPHVGRENGYYQ